MNMKQKPINKNLDLKEYAVKMRKNMTDEEKKVWYRILKGRVPRFHRQQIIGKYIVDFYCPELRLVIEIDGYQHFCPITLSMITGAQLILRRRIYTFFVLKTQR